MMFVTMRRTEIFVGRGRPRRLLQVEVAENAERCALLRSPGHRRVSITGAGSLFRVAGADVRATRYTLGSAIAAAKKMVRG